MTEPLFAGEVLPHRHGSKVRSHASRLAPADIPGMDGKLALTYRPSYRRACRVTIRRLVPH
jgi:hypothetical protein